MSTNVYFLSCNHLKSVHGKNYLRRRFHWYFHDTSQTMSSWMCLTACGGSPPSTLHDHAPLHCMSPGIKWKVSITQRFDSEGDSFDVSILSVSGKCLSRKGSMVMIFISVHHLQGLAWEAVQNVMFRFIFCSEVTFTCCYITCNVTPDTQPSNWETWIEVSVVLWHQLNDTRWCNAWLYEWCMCSH